MKSNSKTNCSIMQVGGFATRENEFKAYVILPDTGIIAFDSFSEASRALSLIAIHEEKMIKLAKGGCDE